MKELRLMLKGSVSKRLDAQRDGTVTWMILL